MRSNAEQVTTLFTADAETMRRLMTIAEGLGDVAVTPLNRFNASSALPTNERDRQLALDINVDALLRQNPNSRLLIAAFWRSCGVSMLIVCAIF